MDLVNFVDDKSAGTQVPVKTNPVVGLPEDGDFVYGHEAIIESIELNSLKTFPLRVGMVVSGYLIEGCSALHEINVEQQLQEFNLSVITRRPTGDVICTVEIEPFYEIVDVDIESLVTGTFSVNVQDLRMDFSLISIDSDNPEHGIEKTVKEVAQDMWDIQMAFEFDYPFENFPQELVVAMTSTYEEKSPFVTLTWYTPDGERIKVSDVTARRREVVRFELQDRLVRQMGGLPPRIGLLMVPDSDPPEVQQGKYQLYIDTIVFEEHSDIDVRFICLVQVHSNEDW